MAGSNVNIAPERSEIEVSLFGPGYGESIVLHLGENLWLIVDSCLDPLTRDPAPLTKNARKAPAFMPEMDSASKGVPSIGANLLFLRYSCHDYHYA